MATATLDTTTERGKHVERRLREDIIAWLTTVRPNGQPDSVPVWFLWDGETILIYSRPDKTKLHNLARNPRVTLTIDDTKGGGDVIRIEGTARVVDGHPPAQDVPAYAAKYGDSIRYIGYADAADFAQHYSVAIVVTTARFRV
jgi:PPOX class probable F420-dependent enzyme